MENMRTVIIGGGNTGKTMATAIEKNTNIICVLHDVVDSQLTDLRKPEPFLITRLLDFEEPWIDPNEPIINYKKHEQTCAKNRKARKKKKHR